MIMYQKLPKECQDTLREVEPLREVPSDRKLQEDTYKTLKETFNK